MDLKSKIYYINTDHRMYSAKNVTKSIPIWLKALIITFSVITFMIIYRIASGDFPTLLASSCVGLVALSFVAPIPSPQKIRANNNKAFKYAEYKNSRQKAVASTPVKSSSPATPVVENPSPNNVKKSAVSAEKAPTAPTPKTTDFECVEGSKSGVTFDDIAGYESTKASMQFVVECLTNRKKLQDMGAKLPTGILLYGPPGTGKTLFAKAIASSSNTKMYMANASQFVELYVGQGAKNVRTLFKTARENAPSIVFIDEIDAVGGKRTSQMNDERRQTLNALLVELNGTNDNDGIMVIAATNDMDSLDQALLRPGRFDRKIAIPLPDKSDREKIIKVHFKNKRVAEDVDIEELAFMTEGMSGSAIATLANEAAIHAVSENKGIIDKVDVDAALFQIIMDGEKKSITNPDDLKTVAYHEAGHALATKLLTSYSVPTVTIIGSTSGAGGVTFRYLNEERAFSSKKDMESHIKVLYAGRAAEECFFGNTDDITTGASSDLKKASVLIKEYLTTYGMSSDSLLNVSVFTQVDDVSLLNEAKRLSKTLYGSTQELLHNNYDILEDIANELLEKKSLGDAELTEIINRHKPFAFA